MLSVIGLVLTAGIGLSVLHGVVTFCALLAKGRA